MFVKGATGQYFLLNIIIIIVIVIVIIIIIIIIIISDAPWCQAMPRDTGVRKW